MAVENETPNLSDADAAATGGDGDATETTILGAAQADEAGGDDKGAGGDDAAAKDDKGGEGDTQADKDAKADKKDGEEGEETPEAKAAREAAEAEADAKVPEGDYKVDIDATAYPGITVSPERLAEVTPALKAANVTQGQMKALAPLYAQGIKEAVDGVQSGVKAAISAARKAWAEETEKDPDLGGDKLPQTRALAAKAIDALGGPTLRSFLDESGLGNHPEMIRFAAKAGKALSESTFHTGDHTQQETGAKSAKDKWYPDYPEPPKQ